MKTNQISNKLIQSLKNETKLDVSEGDIRRLFEAYVEMKQKTYTKIVNAESIFERYEHISYESNEMMIIAVVNNRLEIIHDEIVYRGQESQIPVDIKDVLKVPLMNHGSNFVIIHNHPSGYSKLSDEDVIMAGRTGEAAELIGLKMIDSITIARDGFDSVRNSYPELWNNFKGVYKSSLRDREVLLTPSSLESNDLITNLVNNTFDILKTVDMFEKALYTPYQEKDDFILEIEAKSRELNVSKILLEFDINENMNPSYLAKQIVEEVQMQYDLPMSLENELATMVDDIDNNFQQEIENKLKPLQLLAEEHTGKSGLQFDADKFFIDNYCNLEYGTIDIKSYIDDILKSFASSEMDYQDCVELLEVIYLYSEQVGMNVEQDLLSFAELHYYVLEDTMFELTSGTTEFLNLNLEFDVDSFSENYREIFNMYSDIVMTRLYEDYVEDLDLKNVYFFDEDNISIWGEYKYVNIENTICLANIQWDNLSIYSQDEIENIEAQLKWFKKEYEEDNTRQLDKLGEFKQPRTGREIMEDTKGYVKEKLDEMHEEGIIDTERYEALYEDLGTIGNVDDELFNTLNTDTRVIIGDIFDELYHQIEEQYNEMSLSGLGIELNLDALEHKELLELNSKMDILESKVTSLVNDPEHYFSYKKWQKYDSSSTLNDTYADTMSDYIPHKALNFNTEEFRTKLIETHNSVETKYEYIKQLEPSLYIEAIDLVGFSKEELYQVKQLAEELNLKVSPNLLEDGVCKEVFGNEIDNSYLVDDYFKNNYPDISEENKSRLVNELPYLKNDIINGLNTSASVKQLLTTVNSDKQELELKDVYLLDKGEQSILTNIAEDKGLTINSDIKGTPFEETFGKLPESKKSKNKSNEMEM